MDLRNATEIAVSLIAIVSALLGLLAWLYRVIIAKPQIQLSKNLNKLAYDVKGSVDRLNESIVALSEDMKREHETVDKRLDKLNNTVSTHDATLRQHEARISRIEK